MLSRQKLFDKLNSDEDQAMKRLSKERSTDLNHKGQTRLQVAAQNGELDEVERLLNFASEARYYLRRCLEKI